MIFHSYVNLPEGTWPVKSHSSCHFGKVVRWVATCFHSTNVICRLRSPCSLAFPKHIPSKYPGALGATGQPTLWPLGWPPNHDGSCFSMIFHGKRLHNYGTSPFLGTTTVSMVMFNSYVKLPGGILVSSMIKLNCTMLNISLFCPITNRTIFWCGGEWLGRWIVASTGSLSVSFAVQDLPVCLKLEQSPQNPSESNGLSSFSPVFKIKHG